MSEINDFQLLIEKYQSDYQDFDLLRRHIVDYFTLHPKAEPYVHTVKSRLKDPNHLAEKIVRKWKNENTISVDNLYSKITDLAGVRVLLLHQKQFDGIKEAIDCRIEKGEWILVEPPKAYTWDPEAENYFKCLGLDTHKKDSFYTSVHYLVKQFDKSDICCEIQIRTLFEEIWGEVDHAINYPEKTDMEVCRDQILVLAKLIGAGSRLVDSIFNSHKK
ncbi:RelA/SpoT domain-containing protein [Methylomicrobium lacus]|uniref:RelA/SpoT domain-containing protein n=1 Tax=Methylomicrobium lacus TaxID=136992 RepID=UPI0035A81F15